MDEQIGVRGLLRQMRREAPLWTATLPQLPRLVHRALESNPTERLGGIELAIRRVERTQRAQTIVLATLVAVLTGIVLVYAYLLFAYA
jgi:ubiquinone biosynthesis protein